MLAEDKAHLLFFFGRNLLAVSAVCSFCQLSHFMLHCNFSIYVVHTLAVFLNALWSVEGSRTWLLRVQRVETVVSSLQSPYLRHRVKLNSSRHSNHGLMKAASASEIKRRQCNLLMLQIQERLGCHVKGLRERCPVWTY